MAAITQPDHRTTGAEAGKAVDQVGKCNNKGAPCEWLWSEESTGRGRVLLASQQEGEHVERPVQDGQPRPQGPEKMRARWREKERWFLVSPATPSLSSGPRGVHRPPQSCPELPSPDGSVPPGDNAAVLRNQSQPWVCRLAGTLPALSKKASRSFCCLRLRRPEASAVEPPPTPLLGC